MMSQAFVTAQAHTRSEAETRMLARTLAQALKPRDVIALEGELGAGKTCFTRGIAEGLGIDPAKVSSPTFVIVHEYEGQRLTLVHIDAYRLAGPDDLEAIGWSEIVSDDDAVIAIEWPSRIAAALPRERIEVALQSVSESERLIRFTAPASVADRLAGLGAGPPNAPAARSQPCRTCGKPIDAGLRTWPFCSDRCRMADLGAWFKGGYKVSRPLQPDDE
jgi:tRNA threonylcarbamoyladenosine biosynthesis protein TsaE